MQPSSLLSTGKTAAVVSYTTKTGTLYSVPPLWHFNSAITFERSSNYPWKLYAYARAR